MRRHEYESRYNPAATELSRALIHDGGIHPDTLDKITRVLDGVKHTDEMISQKDTELQSKNNLLVQKDQVIVQKESVINQKTVEIQNTKQVLFKKDQIIAQKEQSLEQLKKNGNVGVREEFIYLLNKLSPEAYSADFSKWSDKLPMKKHVVNNDIQVMEKNIKIYKKQIEEKEQETIKKEFISSLHERYPNAYSANFEEWTDNLPMKTHVINNNFYVMVKNTATYQKEIEEINTKKLEDAKRLKEEEEARKEQVLIDNHREIEDLKALIAQKELEKQEVLTKTENVLNSKDQLLVAKDNEMESLRNLLLQKELETQELLAQQEIEKQELLAQKEAELHDKLHNKSLVKNQVIGELHGALNSQEKEAYKLQIELLTKQLAFKEKESELKDKALELKDKALEDARAISELKGQLLTLKALYGHDISFSEQFSAIQFRAENSIENKDFDDIADLSRYISRLVEAEKENSVSLDISELLNNLSPVVHGEENHIQNPLAVINNFDINHINTTHSVYPSGEVSESYEII